MDNASELLFRSLTRYFIPGLVFLVTVIVIPQLVVDDAILLAALGKLQAPHVLLSALAVGYLLDSLGAYSWTICFRRYAEVRREFSKSLQNLTGLVAADPDEHISAIWLADEPTYERILRERADWVLILEASFSLMVGGAICLGIALVRDSGQNWLAIKEVCTGLLLFLGAYFSARKGIQRLTAHNRKVEFALKRIIESANAERAKLPIRVPIPTQDPQPEK